MWIPLSSTYKFGFIPEIPFHIRNIKIDHKKQSTNMCAAIRIYKIFKIKYLLKSVFTKKSSRGFFVAWAILPKALRNYLNDVYIEDGFFF